MNNQKLTFLDRMRAPTPAFFKKLRNIGIVITAASAVVLTTPIIFPPAFVSIAGYLAITGGVISAISQITVDGE